MELTAIARRCPTGLLLAKCGAARYNPAMHSLRALWVGVAGLGLALNLAAGTPPRWPEAAALARGPWHLPLLSGQTGVVFTMYGAPGELPRLRELVEVMRREQLGNGFDPGPGPGPGAAPVLEYLATVGWPLVCYSGGEMQIKGGRSVFGPEHEASLAPLDRASVFTAVQLGEWGYYLHNLAATESWWRDVYGREFDNFKHLMKPRGLAGYERRPESKQECYDYVRDYFQSRQRDLLGRVISVTGHSHYEAYAGEWGARCIGLEVAENIAFTQSKFAFARGAARQWQRPWSVQVSPWFNGACTTSGPLRKEGGGARGLDAGHSLSLYERLWLHAWFAGAAMVTPENSVGIFFEKPEAPWILTTHARKAVEVFTLMRQHDRGVPYTPVAVVLDHLAGYNAYMDKPWGILEPTVGDREIRDLFDHQLYPGSDHIHARPDPDNPEASYLRPTPYGELVDVLQTRVPPELLAAYPVILLAGDIDFDVAFLGELEKALRRGSRVLMSQRHRGALGAGFDRLASQGRVEVLQPALNPATRRPTAITPARLQELAEECWPVRVGGDPVGYQINRVPDGWVVELINNRGVRKTPDQPAVIDPAGAIRVTLTPRFECRAIRAWRSGATFNVTQPVELTVGPGAVEYVEFTETHP